MVFKKGTFRAKWAWPRIINATSKRWPINIGSNRNLTSKLNAASLYSLPSENRLTSNQDPQLLSEKSADLGIEQFHQ